MSRGLRLIPVILLLWLVAGLAWRLIKPADTAIPSQMVERQLPQFQLPAAVSEKPGLASSDLATGQPRLLNIFASWCVPCAAEAPNLARLEAGGANIVAVAIRDRSEDVTAFLEAYGNPFSRIGKDDISAVQLSIGSSGVPETFVIDGQGVIRYQHIGDIRDEDVAVLLDKLHEAGA